MAGLNGMQKLINAYRRMHGQADDVIVDTKRSLTFMFANGEKNESVSTYVFPRYFEGDDENVTTACLSFAVFDKSSPILLGMDVAAALDVIIDTTKGTVFSRLLGRLLPTMRMPTGHLAWDLRPTDEDVSARHRTGRVFDKDSVAEAAPSARANYNVGADRESWGLAQRHVATEVGTLPADEKHATRLSLRRLCQPSQLKHASVRLPAVLECPRWSIGQLSRSASTASGPRIGGSRRLRPGRSQNAATRPRHFSRSATAGPSRSAVDFAMLAGRAPRMRGHGSSRPGRSICRGPHRHRVRGLF